MSTKPVQFKPVTFSHNSVSAFQTQKYSQGIPRNLQHDGANNTHNRIREKTRRASSVHRILQFSTAVAFEVIVGFSSRNPAASRLAGGLGIDRREYACAIYTFPTYFLSSLHNRILIVAGAVLMGVIIDRSGIIKLFGEKTGAV